MDDEYRMLWESIGRNFTAQQNFVSLAYTITITALGFAFSQKITYMTPYIFLLPLIFLVMTVYRNLSEQAAIIKIAAYLIVFFEKEYPDGAQWQKNNQEYELYIQKKLIDAKILGKNKNNPLRYMKSIYEYALSIVIMLCIALYTIYAFVLRSPYHIDYFILITVCLLEISCVISTANASNWTKRRQEAIDSWQEFKKFRDAANE